MTFEEDFPELDKALDEYNRAKINFPIKELRNHCLSKQKVREAIKKHNCSYCSLYEISKELKL